MEATLLAVAVVLAEATAEVRALLGTDDAKADFAETSFVIPDAAVPLDMASFFPIYSLSLLRIFLSRSTSPELGTAAVTLRDRTATAVLDTTVRLINKLRERGTDRNMMTTNNKINRL